MVSVPTNTFLANLVLPAGSPITSDPYQFSGAAFNFQAGSCPQPFGNLTDITYCSAWCVNSCPDLNPSLTVGTQTSIEQLQTTSSYVSTALSAANAALASQTAPVNVTGAVSFPLTGSESTALVNSIIAAIPATLSGAVTYPVSFSV